MPLPTFSFETPVSPEDAKHDKIQIGLDHAALVGDADDVRNFLNYLGSPPRDQRSGDEARAYGTFFSRARENDPASSGRFFATQQLRKRVLVVEGQRHRPPLIGGSLTVERPPSGAWLLHATLSLNPTRFLRHQPMPSRTTLFMSTSRDFAVSLFEREIPRSYAGEFALVENDNWIPNDRLWQRFASPALWPIHLRNCLSGLTEALISDISRAVEMAGNVNLSGQWHFNLQSVESYWEFFSHDPIGVVNSLEPLLRSYSPRPVNTSEQAFGTERTQNSRCLRLEIRIGETLKIYAKTNRRIRFEIIHQLAGQGAFRIPRGGHTFLTIGPMLPLLRVLTRNAAETVNRVLEHFRLNASVPPRHFSVLEFIERMQRACGAETAHELLQLLIHNDSFVVGHDNPLGEVFRDAMRRLVRLNILQTSNGLYTVTSEYRAALQIMQRRELGFLLTTRIRRKPR